MRRYALLAALCAALAACAPAAPPAAPPKPATPPEPIDGIYRGTSTRFQADLKSCPHPGLVLLVVQNHQFSYHWSYGVYVDGTVAEDGTVQGTAPSFTLVGKRDGKRMEGDVTNGTCGLHFTVIKTDQ
ncbi:MAG TPA: hypothetical protein VK726_27605 [Acetobacteraceae bacterium]|jgi:hypothetical protein|nr:hypothetical protein [Acetobacteraceae bacterium]